MIRTLAYRLNRRYVHRAAVDRRHARSRTVLYLSVYNGLSAGLWLVAGVATVAFLLVFAGAVAYGVQS